jgi:large subunit ribosomal protein L23
VPTLHQIIVRPHITEKSSLAYQERGEYHFVVHPDANKIAIKQAIEQLFGVKVTGVWTSNQRGKTRRVGKTSGTRPNWKKAIVKLRDGDTIESFGFEG